MVNSINSNIDKTTDNEVTEVDEINSINFNQEILFSLFKEKKDSVLRKLGEKYQIAGAGVEGSEEGYYYEDHGITIIFENDYIYEIYCDTKVQIQDRVS